MDLQKEKWYWTNTDIYNIDLDEVLSKGMSTEVFDGNLGMLLSSEDMEILKHNLDKMKNIKPVFQKNTLVKVVALEITDNIITYIELETADKEEIALGYFRVDFLKKFNNKNSYKGK